mgnify:CR=1 FL=1
MISWTSEGSKIKMPKRTGEKRTVPHPTQYNGNNWMQVLWWILAVVVATVVPYIPSLKGNFVTDDWAIIVKDPLAHTLSNAPKAFLTDFLHGYFGPEQFYYRPLVTITFQANWEMAGPNPFVYRLTNLLMAVITSLLVFYLARRTTRSLFAAGIAGVFFAVLPSHSEAVGWIAGRTDVMSCMFALATILVFIAAYDIRPKFSWPLATTCGFLFLCGLFSKENALTIPALLAGFVWIFGSSMRRDEALKWSAVFVLPLVLFIVMRSRALDVTLARFLTIELDKRLLGIGMAYAAYMRMLFVPMKVCVVYDVFPIGMKYPIIAVAAWAVPIGLASVAIWARRRIPVVSFSALWMLVTLLPVTNIIPTGGLVPADRFVFLASVGSSTLLGWLAWRMYEYRPKSIRLWKLIAATFICWFTVYCSLLTVESNQIYSSNIGWAQAVAKCNRRWLRQCSGYYFWKAGMLKEAVTEYRAAIKYEPDNLTAYLELSAVLRALGRPQEALEVMLLAQERFPPRGRIEYNLGVAYAEIGDLPQAAAAFARAVEIQPRYWRAWRNLGKANLKLGNYAEAIRAYERAFAITDLGPMSRIELGQAYKALGQIEKAKREFSMAISADPNGPTAKLASRELALLGSSN